MTHIILKKNIKILINEQDLKVSKEFYNDFDLAVQDLLLKCCNRAKLNDRTTVMKKDL